MKMKSAQSFKTAWRKFLRLMTNTIVAYTVIAGLIAGAFKVGMLYQEVISTKEYNHLCIDFMQKEGDTEKEKDELLREIYELRKQNSNLEQKIIELKMRILNYERQTKE